MLINLLICWTVYLDVDANNREDPLLLIVNTANEQMFNRKWSIRIQQIPCQSPFRGEPNIIKCLNLNAILELDLKISNVC